MKKISLIIILLICGYLFPQSRNITSKEVTYQNKSIKLAANFVYPESNEKLPAVVIVHGSGTSARNNPWTAAYTDALSKRGIIVLHPDKRGSGKSGGDWKTASLSDLAEDAIAGVDFLRSQPEVDTNKIAVIGFSQGGDVIPIVAAESYKVKMVIDVSGSVIPLKEQISDEVMKMGEREGLTAEQNKTLKNIIDLSYKYVNDRTKWDEYISALKSVLQTDLGKLESFKGFPQEKELWVWDWLKLVSDVDPMNYWKNVNVPVLFIFGGNDTQIDIRKSIDLIHDNLDPLKKNYSVLFFQLNGHALYRDDCNDFIARWLHDKGVH